MSKDKEDKFKELREELDPALVEIVKRDVKLSTCELDHSGDPRGSGPYPAVNTLMIKHDHGLFSLHVCEVCSISLAEENSDWYLFICFGCLQTKWTYKDYLHRDYKEQIIGMNECPDCAAKISGNC